MVDLKQHAEYSKWAMLRTLGACAALTPEELTRDLGTSFRSVLGTLIHGFCADRMWLSRIEGARRKSMLDPGEMVTMAVLKSEWPAILDRLIEQAAGVSRDEATADVVYQRTNGEEQSTPFWQVILHVVNHASYHRGQVAAMLRQM
ncbi:MAG: DUF664 domain-containing protein, partial [bacterium]|nr:DUF664 domain-containing protein [bacterium]